MKITLKMPSPAKPIQTSESLRFDIAKKLNELVNSSDSFFSWTKDRYNDFNLSTRDCANVTMHNRLIILLALFTDSPKNSGVYTQFYSPVAFSGYDTVEKLQELKDFVDSIPPLNDVKIELA